MAFQSELDRLELASLIEAFSTFVGAAGLPAYMGWQGDSVLQFGLYSIGAGLGLAAGSTMLHPAAWIGTKSLFLLWIFQTVAVTLFGGLAFELAGQFR